MNQLSPKLQRNRGITRLLRGAVFIILVLLACSYLVAVSLGLVTPTNRFTTPEIMVGVALLLVAAFVAQRSYVIRDLVLGPTGVSAHFDRIEKRQNELETEIQALQVAVTGLVTKYELSHLEKLAADTRAVVTYSNHMLNELERLDAMTYIVPTDLRGLNAVKQDHGSGLDDFDLKDYVRLTEEGRQYLSLRAQLAARTAAAKAGMS